MSPLQSDALYYYCISDIPISASLSQGISIEEFREPKTPGKGVLRWFDKIAAQDRAVEIVEIPSTLGKEISLRGTDGLIHSFQYVDKNVYDTLIKRLLPSAPPFHSEEEIQSYLTNLNPYT